MYWKTDKEISGYFQAVWIAYYEGTFHQPERGKSHVRGNKKTPIKHIVASYTAKIQIMPPCNPFTISKLRSTVGTCSLKDNSDTINC